MVDDLEFEVEVEVEGGEWLYGDGLGVGEEEGVVDEGEENGGLWGEGGGAKGVFESDLLLVEMLDGEVLDGLEEGLWCEGDVGEFDIHDGN